MIAYSLTGPQQAIRGRVILSRKWIHSHLTKPLVVQSKLCEYSVSAVCGPLEREELPSPCLVGGTSSLEHHTLPGIGRVIDVTKTSLLRCLASWPVHSITVTSITNPIIIKLGPEKEK